MRMKKRKLRWFFFFEKQRILEKVSFQKILDIFQIFDLFFIVESLQRKDGPDFVN